MLRITLILISFILQTGTFANTNTNEIPTQNVPSEIKSITVFLNNAEIHREVEVEIAQGKSEIIFENISSRILDKGIKIATPNGCSSILIQRKLITASKS